MMPPKVAFAYLILFAMYGAAFLFAPRFIGGLTGILAVICAFVWACFTVADYRDEQS